MNDPTTGPSPNALPVMPVMKGTLDLLALKALAARPMHGFEVTAWIEERSDARLAFDDSAVYQALYRLEKRDLAEADWGRTENNRRARYYSLTPEGRAHLREETDRLVRYNEIVTGILTAASGAARPA
jgi:transcriptional regulator